MPRPSFCSFLCCAKQKSRKHEPEKDNLDKFPREEECVAPSVPYGTLYAYGYNGQLPLQNRGRYKTYFKLEQRSMANGLVAVDHFALNSEQAKASLADGSEVIFMDDSVFYVNHAVFEPTALLFRLSELKQRTKIEQSSYTCKFNGATTKTVSKYEIEKSTDMFQIGRSAETQVDFIVMDTIPGEETISEKFASRSTISRFACRILVDRNPPHSVRLFAAAFDAKNRIQIGENLPQWKREDDTCDGLTTNGVLLMHQKGDWNKSMKPGLWREVSVAGDIYSLRKTRSAKERGQPIQDSNVLRDGTMIDLCGVVMLFRTVEGLEKAPTVEELIRKRDDINAKRPQCPVGLMTIRFPSSQVNQKQIDMHSIPHVYINCGHVHGYHSWGKSQTPNEEVDDNERTCPICRESGPFIPLKFGMEPAFYVDNGPLTHAFCPCGHVTSEATAQYWSQMPLPYGKDEFRPACPFCAKPLEGLDGFVKLIFQTE